MDRQVHPLQQGPVRQPPARPSARSRRAHRGTHLTSFAEAAGSVGTVDAAAAAEAAALHLRLTKPVGSLGVLEEVGVRLAAMAGTSPPPVPSPAAVTVFAADHGVLEERVSPWPQEVTAQMVANFCAGGAAINVLARHTSSHVVVVDVGVARPLDPAPGLLSRKVRPGTDNLAVRPAMTVDEARAALDVGAEVAVMAVGNGARCLVTGDMGIGNTTPSAALVAAFTGLPAAEVTGRGTGVDDTTWRRKVEVVERAIARVESDGHLGSGEPDAVAVLASVGGLEIAAIAGYITGGAAARVPVLVDGVIALSALLVAAAITPSVVPFCLAGHRSTEPGASAAMGHLGMKPLLDLELRLGEGTGACLAVPLVQAAAKILREMATFDSAGVAHKDDA